MSTLRADLNAAAMQGQVGGSHYKTMGMQPFEFSMANGWDPLAHTILKYVARHQSKGGKQDLEKAAHCVEMRAALLPGFKRAHKLPHGGFYGIGFEIGYGIEDFISKNNLEMPERGPLRRLAQWVYNDHEVTLPAMVWQEIQDLIAFRYPEA